MKRPPGWCRSATTGRDFRSASCLLPAACCLLILGGCPGTDSQEGPRPEGPLPPEAKLRLVVVDDPTMARAIEQLRGEWQAQTGSDYEVHQMSVSELAATDHLGVDAVICPSHQLGTLAEKGNAVPVPEPFRQDEKGAWAEIFDLLRAGEAVWGTEAVAVPFGSPVLTCYYRADLLEKLDRSAPRTWAEYSDLAKLLADRTRLGDTAFIDDAEWTGALEPLGPGWAGVVLLARAAAYATHREHYSTLFQIDTMEPLIDGAAFVRALEELVAVASLGPPEQLKYDPAAVRAAFWEGRCGLALSWPTPAGTDALAVADGVQVGFAELPGATDVYNFAKRRWEVRDKEEDPHVPLLAVAGRLGIVTKRCQWPGAAFHLLFWLSDDRSSRQVSTASAQATLFRQSHLAVPQAWVEPPVTAEQAAKYAEMTRLALCRQQRLFALRIPGRADYLAALDEAVHQAVRGRQTPQEALSEAAEHWREITLKLGRDAERDAYCRSVGLN